MARHKAFISYHHANDQQYKDWLISNFKDIVFIDHSVGEGDINPSNSTDYTRNLIRTDFLSDSTVTLVLIGTQTWQRKHVDWEIGASIRDTVTNPRSGLVGLILPTRKDFQKTNRDYCSIPPRLWDNIECGYASIHDFPVNNVKYILLKTDFLNVTESLKRIIEEAYKIGEKSRRTNNPSPNNSRMYYANNRSANSTSWC